MNFVARNLGWLLLLLFFLFMLFIISTNNKNWDDANQKWSSLINKETLSWSEDLDTLMKMINEDNEDNKNADLWGEKQELVKVVDNNSKTSQEDEKKIKQGFFSKLFRKNNKNEKWDKKEDTGIKKNTIQEKSKGNLIKKTGEQQVSISSYSNIKKYAPEILKESSYPGINLETKIGKQYKIGVHSLKLNNAYFNKTLAYMMKGDRVKQRTEENSYGCFQVEVLSGKKNVGKIGYVCKKYLEEDTINDILREEKTTQKEVSKVWDIITIEKTVTFWNGITLIPWDRIDQMSPLDKYGCFMAHVYSSAVAPSVVPVGMLCMKDIK